MSEILSSCLTEIIGLILTALCTYLGIFVKRYLKKWLDTKEKKAIANDVVMMVEQVYKDIHGDEKLNKALSCFAKLLTEKGLSTTSEEMKVLLQSAVGTFNDAFNKE